MHNDTDEDDYISVGSATNFNEDNNEYFTRKKYFIRTD